MARAFSDRRAGASISAVAQRLGMPPGGMRRLLRNRVYLGELRDGEFANRTAHPAIVDRETFDAVQDGPSRPARSIRGPALLAGLVRCSGCGHVMSRQSAARVVYGCAVRHSGERCPSPASVTATLLEAHVEQVALAELERLRVSAGHGHRLERAMQRVTDAEAELRDYLKMVNLAGIDVRVAAEAARERQRVATARAKRYGPSSPNRSAAVPGLRR